MCSSGKVEIEYMIRNRIEKKNRNAIWKSVTLNVLFIFEVFYFLRSKRTKNDGKIEIEYIIRSRVEKENRNALCH